MAFRLREEHLIFLTNFMESHPDFATGRLSASNARPKFRELWLELTKGLNSLGFGIRSIEKWQKTWTDYKVNLKKKASEIKRHQEATGGGPEFKKTLTELELRILSILGQTFYLGCGVMEHGLKKQSTSADTNGLSISRGIDMEDNIAVDISLPTTSKVTNISEAKNESSYDTNESVKRDITDHDYLVSSTPLNKRRRTTPQKNDINFVYEDTIKALRSIENTVVNQLQSFESTVSNKLDALRQTIQEELHDINLTLKTCLAKGV